MLPQKREKMRLETCMLIFIKQKCKAQLTKGKRVNNYLTSLNSKAHHQKEKGKMVTVLNPVTANEANFDIAGINMVRSKR